MRELAHHEALARADAGLADRVEERDLDPRVGRDDGVYLRRQPRAEHGSVSPVEGQRGQPQ